MVHMDPEMYLSRLVPAPLQQHPGAFQMQTTAAVTKEKENPSRPGKSQGVSPTHFQTSFLKVHFLCLL